MPRRKIISEFSLCEQPKAELAAFLANNIDALNANDPAAKRALIELIKGTEEKPGVFPEAALKHMQKVLSGTSDEAVLIRNLPENSDVDFGNVTSTIKLQQHMFTHHIGVALFEICGLQHKQSAFTNIRVNPKHTDYVTRKGPHVGTHSHRDFPSNDPTASRKPISYAAFSAPLNDEEAPTDLFILEDVLESIPFDVRERTKALIEFFQLHSSDEDAPPIIMTLQEILEHLQDPSKDSQTIAVFDPRNFKSDLRKPDNTHYEVANTPEDLRTVLDAIDEHSNRVILGKGDLLVFGEERIFHQGHPGDESRIAAIPPEQRNTRLLLHNAGGPPTIGRK